MHSFRAEISELPGQIMKFSVRMRQTFHPSPDDALLGENERGKSGTALLR